MLFLPGFQPTLWQIFRQRRKRRQDLHGHHPTSHAGPVLHPEPQAPGAHLHVGQHAANGRAGHDLLLPAERPAPNMGPKTIRNMVKNFF